MCEKDMKEIIQEGHVFNGSPPVNSFFRTKERKALAFSRQWYQFSCLVEKEKSISFFRPFKVFMKGNLFKSLTSG
jgi:hypothetical protein